MKAGLVRGNRLHVLADADLLVGREPDCDVVLSDEGVSRHHALFVPCDGRHLVVDLVSANGVLVEGRSVRSHLLRDGERVRIGGVEFRYQAASDTPPPSPPAVDEARASGSSGLLSRVVAGEIDEILEERGERDDTLRLAMLFAVNQLVGTMVRLDELMPRVAELALKVFGADRTLLLLRDETGELVARASLTRSGRRSSDGLEAFSRSIVETCAESREAVLTDDAAADPRFAEAGSVQMLNIRCAMAAPMIRGETFYGVLYLDNRMQSECFSEGDLRMLCAFASQVALAIENARLLQRVEEHMLRLQRQQEVLLHQEKMATLGELAAGVAHEVRSPLTVISSYAEMLHRRFDAAQAEDWIDAIMRGCERISRIVGSLLDFSRKGRGQWQDVSVNHLVQETVAMAEHSLACFRNVEVRKSWAPVLPVIRADGQLLQQVFLNLIMNAAQAMEAGGSLSISTSVREMEGREWIAVDFADTGHGIPADRMDRIFDPFVTFKDGGTGLGLSICRRIIDEHGGRIEVESTEGEGARFRILLPGRGEEGGA